MSLSDIVEIHATRAAVTEGLFQYFPALPSSPNVKMDKGRQWAPHDAALSSHASAQVHRVQHVSAGVHHGANNRSVDKYVVGTSNISIGQHAMLREDSAPVMLPADSNIRDYPSVGPSNINNSRSDVQKGVGSSKLTMEGHAKDQVYGVKSAVLSTAYVQRGVSYTEVVGPSNTFLVSPLKLTYSAVAALPASTKSGEPVKVLVIGGGGREHALCYGLQRSSSCGAVYCAPGNPGIASSSDATCIPDLDISDSPSVVFFCQMWGIGLVVVGPEAPLVAGLVDDLQAAGIVAFGPSAKASALEGSKDFMKRLCDKYDIPTAKYKSFISAEDAKMYIREIGVPIVVKADGLAAGKGVIIATTLQEAFDAVDSMLVEKAFGDAGGLVIVEEFLDGEEVSFFALVDGESAIPMASAQDHKRVGDGDTGPNTGGMGAYSPAPALTPGLEAIVMDTIILPTVKGMAKEGCKFVGVLYAGLIIDKRSGMPKLLEYNVRFGDPECQVLIPRLQSDLASSLLAACKGELAGLSLSWSDEAALVVVVASQGYPGKYKKGTVIRNLEGVQDAAPKVKIFYAGTDVDSQGNVVASGGRVLGVVALGEDIAEAQRRAYQAVEKVDWPDGFCRRDIGWRAVARLQKCES